MGADNIAVEVDIWNAWFAAFATWDATINFWLTATFAVIVSTHTLSHSITPSLRRLLATLYIAFCVYTLLRGTSLYLLGVQLSSEMMSQGVRFSPATALANFLSNVAIILIFVGGSIGASRFILTTSKSAQQEGEHHA